MKHQQADSAERKDKNGDKKKPVPRKERETEREEEEEQQGKTANGKLREEVGAKRAKVEASGDEPKKTVNGRKEGAGKERETSPASVAEGWEKRKGGKRVEKEGKTVERKEAEANGFAKGGNYKQEEDEDYDADTDVDEDNKKYLVRNLGLYCQDEAGSLLVLCLTIILFHFSIGTIFYHSLFFCHVHSVNG